MTREEIILQHINIDGQGIEIGPSHSPLAPKKDGYRVQIIDHLDRERLIEKYEGHGVQLENIEEVDFVWSGQPFAELTGKSKFYDWIIASHVIEHSTDLIGFLNDCDDILKDDGVISLAIPDKRYCFDRFRALTGISSIVDAHLQKSTLHSPGTVAEFYLNVVSKGGQIGWDYLKEGDYDFVHSLAEARAEMDRVIDNKEYIDVHAWCFTPHSLRLIIHDLHSLGLIQLKEMSYFPTSGHEFYMTLGRTGEGAGLDRMEMIKIIEDEETCEKSSKLERKERESSEAVSEIERIYSSHSWRITKPLRKIRPMTHKFVKLVKKS